MRLDDVAASHSTKSSWMPPNPFSILMTKDYGMLEEASKDEAEGAQVSPIQNTQSTAKLTTDKDEDAVECDRIG